MDSKGTLSQGLANGAIVSLTHVELALVLVLAGFAVLSRAFPYGGRTRQFETPSGVLIALIGLFLLWRSLRSDHSAQTEGSNKTPALVTGLIPCPLTTFIMSYALARGLLAAGLAVTAAMVVGMVATIADIVVAAVFTRERFMGLLARTEGWRHRVGRALEIGSSTMGFCSASGLCWAHSRQFIPALGAALPARAIVARAP